MKGSTSTGTGHRVAKYTYSLSYVKETNTAVLTFKTPLKAGQWTRRNAGPTLRPGAKLLMPVRGWKSSDFGMRYDPFFRVWQLHAGVDHAHPYGSAGRAAPGPVGRGPLSICQQTSHRVCSGPPLRAWRSR